MEDEEPSRYNPHLGLLNTRTNILTHLRLQQMGVVKTTQEILNILPVHLTEHNGLTTKTIKFYSIDINNNIDRNIKTLFSNKTKNIYKLELLYNTTDFKYIGIRVEKVEGIEEGPYQHGQEEVYSAKHDEYTLISYNYEVKAAKDNSYTVNDVTLANDLYIDQDYRNIYIINRNSEHDFIKVFKEKYNINASFSINDVIAENLMKVSGGYNKKHKVYYNAKTKKYYIDYNNKKINLTLNNTYKNKGKYYIKLKEEIIEIYI